MWAVLLLGLVVICEAQVPTPCGKLTCILLKKTGNCIRYFYGHFFSIKPFFQFLGLNVVYYPTVYIRSNCLFWLCHESPSYSTDQFDYYPTVYIRSNCLLFHWSINMTIDRHYTMAWLPASLLKSHRRLSTCATCATTMRVRFVYERRHNATMVKIRHGLAALNSNNSIVYGQKHKVWVFVFLVRTCGTF